MTDKDKEQGEPSRGGPKVDPNECKKSTTGEHVWNFSPRPDNKKLGICRYCETQRVFEGTLTPMTKTLPPPPMPRQAVPSIIKLSTPIAAPLASVLSQNTTESKVTIIPARKVLRHKPISRTAAEKLKIIEEFRACKYDEKKNLYKKYSVAYTTLSYWILHEDELRKKVGVLQRMGSPVVVSSDQDKVKLPPQQDKTATKVSYTERLAIVDDFLSGKSGTRLETCKKHNITLHNIDSWIRNQEFYRDVQSRGLKAVRSDITKRSSVLKKLNTIEEATPEEAISILNDWGAIIFRDATRAQAEATRLFEKKNSIDLAIKAIQENMKAQRKLQIEAIKKITEIAK